MDICEFRAWFEGFTEDMPKPPSAKQWKRIKQRVKQVNGTPTTERVFIDRYWRRYEPYWSYLTYTGGSLCSNVNKMTDNAAMASDHPGMNAHNAFTALGKAEAQSITSGVAAI